MENHSPITGKSYHASLSLEEVEQLSPAATRDISLNSPLTNRGKTSLVDYQPYCNSCMQGNQLYSEKFDFNRNGKIALLFSAVLGGLGNGLVPISILTFIHIFLLILGFEWIYRSNEMELFSRRSWTVFGAVILSQGFGFCLGFYGMFGSPSTNAVTIIESIVAGIFSWLLFVGFAIIPHLLYSRLFPRTVGTLFVFPTLQTAISCSLIGNIFSTFTAEANAVLDYDPLRQSAALFGIAGVNFILMFCASFPAILIARYNEFDTIKLRQWISIAIASLLILFTITGYLKQAPYLFQKSASELIPSTIPVSCIMGQTISIGSIEYYQLWNSTQQRIVAGDAIVLMAEEAMNIMDNEEDSLISYAQSILQQSTSSKEVLLGMTYIVNHEGEPLADNRFTLLSYSPQAGNRILWKYDKAHPVPLIEMNIQPGEAQLPFAHSDYGYLSGAICFDLDFPQYIAQAGREGVDIMLQPSWTWNAINFRHFEDNAVRAIENGFTLFRCSSVGESGVVNQQGKFLHRQFTGDDPTVVTLFSIPLSNHTTPMFPFFGFIFEYLCVAGGFYYVIQCILGYRRLRMSYEGEKL